MQWQPRETFSIRVDRDVPVTMRDGTVLMTDVYRPATEGRPGAPATDALQQGDGRLARPDRHLPRRPPRLRGRYPGLPRAVPLRRRLQPVLRWLRRRRVVRQPALVGRQRRYVWHLLRGATQWLAAIAEPPSLRDRPAHRFRLLRGGPIRAARSGFMCNWVPFLTTADLLAPTRARECRTSMNGGTAAIDNLPETAKTLPLTDIRPAWTPYFAEWMAHPSRDEFWRERSIEDRHDRVRARAEHRRLVRHLPRWIAAQLHGCPGIRRDRGGEGGSRLLLGPWTHTTPPLSVRARSISAPWAGRA